MILETQQRNNRLWLARAILATSWRLRADASNAAAPLAQLHDTMQEDNPVASVSASM